LEDLLGIKENNLPIPNSAEWELKTHRSGSNSLTTLFHLEPSPRSARLVTSILLPKYGWRHEEAGIKYPETEMSFRQTINFQSRTDRGFGLVFDKDETKLMVSFDYTNVSPRHSEWLNSVRVRVGHLGELNPQPYWGLDDLYHKAATKLYNCFFVEADVKKENGTEKYRYNKIYMLTEFDKEKFIAGIKSGFVLVDFDARSGHNHGTKFRVREDRIPELYLNVKEF